MSKAEFYKFLLYAAGLIAVLGAANLIQYKLKGRPSIPFGLACFALSGFCLLTRIETPLKWITAVVVAGCLFWDLAIRKRREGP